MLFQSDDIEFELSLVADIAHILLFFAGEKLNTGSLALILFDLFCKFTDSETWLPFEFNFFFFLIFDIIGEISDHILWFLSVAIAVNGELLIFSLQRLVFFLQLIII